MNREYGNIKRHLYLASTLVLLAGVICFALIYRNAVNEEGDGSSYEIMGGFVYPGSGVSSKKYTHELQLYGGKAAVLADDFMRWFSGLWRGKSLAYTVGCIALIAAAAIFLVAHAIPHPATGEDHREVGNDPAGRSR